MQRRTALEAMAAAAASTGFLAGCAATGNAASEAAGNAESAPEGLPPQSRAVIAETPAGRFRGFIREDAPNIRIFFGIPFMKNPYEPIRRFRAPEAFEPFTETVNCFRRGSIPLQPAQPGKAGPKMVGGDGPLCLNIWAPASGTNLPVMVWVPGGGSIRCDQNDARFDGENFARDGVILVTLAYRVNVDGFLRIKGGDSNLGIRDIIAGLRWVKENIAGFGGNPAQITAFGQSAGGTHLADVIASPHARGLLAGCIIQSPSAIAQWTSTTQADCAAQLTAEAIGTVPEREALMKVPFDALAAFGPLSGKLAGDLSWAQMTDGNTSLFKGWVDGDVMPERPVDALARGAARDLRVIAGSTASEWRYYIVPSGRIAQITEKDVEKLIRGANLSPSVSEAYRRAGRGDNPGDRFAQIQSDIIFRMPCLRLIEGLAAGGSRVWAYSFDWESPVSGKSGAPIGAAHTTDVPFVFKTLSAPRARQTLGENPPEQLADAIHAAWVQFAKTGEAPWTAFDFYRRHAMRFSTLSSESEDPWAFERGQIPLPPAR